MKNNNKTPTLLSDYTERGASLIVVLLILVVVTLLGVAGVQISIMAERSARNDRDFQIAWQASEAALLDAEYDISGLISSSPNRRDHLFPQSSKFEDFDRSFFPEDCGNSGASRGLCWSQNTIGKQTWLVIDFTDSTATAKTTAFGAFTNRSFTAGGPGIQPAAHPRYLIEVIPERELSSSTNNKFFYRITAMGFGPNLNTQVVLQTIYRK